MAVIRERRTPAYWVRHTLAVYIPTLLIVGFILLPYVWTFITSIKTTDEMFTKEVIYWPSNFTLQNYSKLLFATDFVQCMLNSFGVAILTTAVSIFAAMLAAYVFARFTFAGSRLVLGGILLLYMFPQVLFLMPIYSMFNKMGMLGNVYSLVIAYTTTTLPYGI